ncbi:hypothetical protein CAPN002_25890 [Capnocytophaga stomatis]|uniref:hypothetical protein n=1 Tax=Capnocytophaga stomatis TaxID=1848904 RepID=UPI00195074B1|nr:hypothetical protein [Capnocytophaga stomatis]GIJ95371.1 hypothetical protein CAPN002_25890 [Capnocytophaga stomatis]
MKANFKIMLWAILLPLSMKSQVIYFDPFVTGAMTGYAITLKNGQNNISKEQSKLQKAQSILNGQMVLVNKVQEKVYKGLSEVSGTLSNGLQVKSILSQIEHCSKYSKNITDLVKRNPQYAFFGAKASQKAYEQILKISSEVTSVIKSGGDNLMMAGDRYKLLDSIEEKVRILKIWLITVQLSLESAERIGFLRSINPFQGYINTDKDIVENIMRKYKHQF